MTIESLIRNIGELYADTLQAALEDARQYIVNDSWDLGTLVKNATWSAYCEGLQAAIDAVKECTDSGLKILAEQKLKSEGLRSMQDPVDVEGPDMNAAYPKVQ